MNGQRHPFKDGNFYTKVKSIIILHPIWLRTTKNICLGYLDVKPSPDMINLFTFTSSYCTSGFLARICTELKPKNH